MRRHRTLKFQLGLLLAMILPLQGFAGTWNCAAPSVAETAQHHCEHGTGTALHHGCGTCCAAAVAVMLASWIAPRSASPYLSLPSSGSLPAVAPDRLDRPPRFIPA
jgi:hypothetical protein